MEKEAYTNTKNKKKGIYLLQNSKKKYLKRKLIAYIYQILPWVTVLFITLYLYIYIYILLFFFFIIIILCICTQFI